GSPPLRATLFHGPLPCYDPISYEMLMSRMRHVNLNTRGCTRYSTRANCPLEMTVSACTVCAHRPESQVAEMTKALPLPDAESFDEFCEECGYEPELKRTLGSFQVFA